MTSRRAHRAGPWRTAVTLLLACAQFVLPARALAMAPAGVVAPDAPGLVGAPTSHGAHAADAHDAPDVHASPESPGQATHEPAGHASHESSGCHGDSPDGPSNCFGADACSAPAVQVAVGAQVSFVTSRVRARPDTVHESPSVCLSQPLRPPKSL